MKETLYKTIYDDIVRKINNGEYLPGEKLPTEFELTQLYGVSRITATRAMKELEHDLYVFRKQKSGTFVRDTINVTNATESDGLLVPVLLQCDKTVGLDTILGAQSVAAQNAIFPTFFHTQNNAKLERNYLKKMLTLNISGLILYPCSMSENLDVLSEYVLRKIPIVYIDRPVRGIQAPCITTDNIAGMHTVVSKLIEKGHTRIAYYPYYSNLPEPEIQRFEGYCKAHIDHGLPILNDLLMVNSTNLAARLATIPVHKQTELMEHHVNQFIDYLESLKHLPTAIVCVNDITASYIIRLLLRRGYRVPQDISVTGFDNLTFKDLPVGITSVQQDFYNLGALAVDTLLCLLSGKSVQPYTYLDCRYIEKGSTHSLYAPKAPPPDVDAANR